MRWTKRKKNKQKNIACVSWIASSLFLHSCKTVRWFCDFLCVFSSVWPSDLFSGFTAITATNPIWLIKTRLQLDARCEALHLHAKLMKVNNITSLLTPYCDYRNRGERQMNAFECVRRVYQMDGLRGFYRGMSASYAGISETVIHFVIYERIKQKLLDFKAHARMDDEDESFRDAFDFLGMMLAAATSKTCATSIAYPHGMLLSQKHFSSSRKSYQIFLAAHSLL